MHAHLPPSILRVAALCNHETHWTVSYCPHPGSGPSSSEFGAIQPYTRQLDTNHYVFKYLTAISAVPMPFVGHKIVICPPKANLTRPMVLT